MERLFSGRDPARNPHWRTKFTETPPWHPVFQLVHFDVRCAPKLKAPDSELDCGFKLESSFSMSIDYDHSANLHTLDGPRAALPKLFPSGLPGSILDVGCGTGTWLRAAIDSGISDVIGIDGVEIPRDRLLFPSDKFHCRDLGAPVDLGRRFAVTICLEVAEHLDPDSGGILIHTLSRHSDVILF